MCVYKDAFLKKFLVLVQDKRCRNWESVSQFLKLEGQADSGTGATIRDCVVIHNQREGEETMRPEGTALQQCLSHAFIQ